MDEINDCVIGVRVFVLCFVRSKKNGVGEKNVVINIVGVIIRFGDFCWVDNDGIFVLIFVVLKKFLS